MLTFSNFDKKLVERDTKIPEEDLMKYVPEYRQAVARRKAQKLIRDIDGGYLPIEGGVSND